MNANKFTLVPIETTQRLPDADGFWHLYRDCYWATDPHETHLYFYRGTSPQCNKYKSVVESVIAGKNHPATNIIFLERVWMPHDCRDYI